MEATFGFGSRQAGKALKGVPVLAALVFGAAACEDETAETAVAETRCDDPSASPLAELPVVGEDLCAAQAATTVGTYRIQNNVWNAGTDTVQCITPRGGGDRVGFDIHGHAGSTEAAPASYPSIVYGWHFGTWTQGALPIRVSELGSVVGSWAVSKTETGSYNQSYDLWLHPEPNPGGSPRGGLEMMIWVHHQGQISPSGDKTGVADVEGRTWSMRYGNVGGWDYVAYIMGCRADRTELDLAEFLRDSAARGLLDPSWYLVSVQAGFEIWNGGEGLATDEFRVEVR